MLQRQAPLLDIGRPKILIDGGRGETNRVRAGKADIRRRFIVGVVESCSKRIRSPIESMGHQYWLNRTDCEQSGSCEQMAELRTQAGPPSWNWVEYIPIRRESLCFLLVELVSHSRLGCQTWYFAVVPPYCSRDLRDKSGPWEHS